MISCERILRICMNIFGDCSNKWISLIVLLLEKINLNGRRRMIKRRKSLKDWREDVIWLWSSIHLEVMVQQLILLDGYGRRLRLMEY